MSNQLLTSPPQPSAAEWAQIVEQSNETQLSLRAFSSQIGVPLQQLYNWRSRLKTSTPTPRLSRGFKEVKPTFAVTPNSMREEGAIEVHLRNGRMVRVTGSRVDTRLLQAVIDLADGGAAC